jgi:predicted nucleic-acid-binding protein
VTGLDTNILLRYFVKDDPNQTPIAVRIMHGLSREEPGWVSLIVLVELYWVLSRTYRIQRSGMTSILESLLASRDIVVEQDDLARRACSLYSRGNADLADCLISASARASGCSRTVTFDRKAARDAGMDMAE